MAIVLSMAMRQLRNIEVAVNILVILLLFFGSYSKQRSSQFQAIF